MVEGEEESKTTEEFDLSTELSTLVSKNVIPKKLAEKLENKLKEKNIKINQKQFQQLIGKIQEIMKTYANTARPQEKSESKEKSVTIQKNGDMQKIIETIEELKEKIIYLEKGTASKPRFVTTDDIKVPEGVIGDAPKWNVEPLTEIPNNPESVIVLMKWLQYLIDKCGRPNLSNILDYYVDIGWITQDAKMGLIDYSQGITDQTKKDETTKKHITDLPSKDHIQSLVYIQKLKGLQLDKHFIDRIESELARITKKIDNC
ncbi:MAG: hypothetical protein AYK22_03050 [Thermoplasmatales archaeon SG8-52-3]|nr:MAG: hypothetical protein AYK22_03050 [Thermoplasmatales archaeon SG8-52-3]